MEVRVEVTERGAGFEAELRNARKLAGKELAVGVLRSAGKTDNGTDLVDIAVWNEYGTSRIPSRPFLRLAADKQGGKWLDLACKAGARVLDGSMEAGQALELVGNQAVADVQKVIGNRSMLAPNAPATVRRKKSDAPLIDTGQLRQAISFEVR